ncbi:MAG: long-chain fatty acid--CoA ligase [Spirochaetes bacterium]|nr:MAG: long-chain fatty acid--CoA ligase [Spirochaetota bacterium]
MQNTIPKVFKENAEKNRDKSVLYYKDKEDKFKTISYGELYRIVSQFGAGLLSIGVKRNDHVGIIADNRKEWIIADLAILGIGAVDVPRGADSTADEVQYILNHGDCHITLAENKKQLEKILSSAKKLPELKTIIVMDSEYKKPAKKTEVVITTFNDILEKGKEKLQKNSNAFEKELNKGTAEDLATIIYTSGTTGEPKGVMLTHNNFLHQVKQIPNILIISHDDVWLSVLPVWHSFERIIEYVVLGSCSAQAYSKPVGKIMLKDMAEVKPAFMASVPRIWEGIRAAIYRNINSEGGIKKSLFYFFVAVGILHETFLNMYKGLLPQFRKRYRAVDITISIIPLILLTPFRLLGNLLVFGKLKKLLGGKFVAAVSGGGALPAYVDKFFGAAGILLLEGYGLTETAPVVSVRLQRAPVPSTVGPMLAGTEVRIMDDKMNVLPPGHKGVVYIKGPQVMKGYYKKPDETRKVLSEDGWLNTGDSGILTHKGELKIIGRVKDTIVLLGGENIEPDPIESAILESDYIEQVIVLGQDQKFLAALVIPNLDEVEKYATENDISYIDRESLVDIPEINELIYDEIHNRVSPQNGFKPFEIIYKIKLLAKPFQVGRELTQTLKMKRNVINEIYAKEIKELFK